MAGFGQMRMSTALYAPAGGADPPITWRVAVEIISTSNEIVRPPRGRRGRNRPEYGP